ncbi:MAG TPA: type II toxin-antitoxin system HicB family antitoxin [Granulicella sp.]|jgi:predicted RNase H-like HicB family nuclease
MREYAVIIQKSTNCWGAYSPDIPGLGVTGSTPEEAEQLIREGIDFHLEGLLEDGDPIPEPTTRVLMVNTEIVEKFRHQLAKSA